MPTLDEKPLWIELLRQENLICGLRAASRDDALSQLCTLLAEKAGTPEEAKQWLTALLAREKIIPTVLSPGFAMPHARIANLKNAMIAAASIPAGLDFNTKTPQPVKLLVLLLTPANDPQLHLKVIKDIAAAFIQRSAEEIDAIAAIESPSDLLAALAQAQK